MLRIFAILFAFLGFCVSSAEAQQARRVSAFKHLSVDQAWQASQESKRPILLFIHSENCRFCVKMEKETYANPKLAAALLATAETVSVSKEEHPELVKHLGIKGYPTTVVVAHDGKEIGRVEGFLNAQKFAAKMFAPPAERQAQQQPAAQPVAQR